MDRAGQFIWFAGALVLIGSALIARARTMPNGRFARLAGVWVLIFALLFAAAHWLDQHR